MTPPASGAWREGDPPGRRRWFTADRPLALESGGVLPGYRVAYETWGTLAPDRANAVLVLHALTGDSHVAGPREPGHPTAGWWDGLVGPGRALDPTRLFLVVPNVIGGCQGSTGPASAAPDGRPWGSRFPALTLRDQVAAEAALADHLGIGTWAMVVGGSMGGMRALEWAVTHPDRVGALALFATTARSSAEQIAWTHAQIEAIRGDPGWHGGDYHHLPPGRGPHRGLGIARRIAHITYRTPSELDTRFGRSRQPGGHARYAVESYLDHHAVKLAHRFDAGTYVVLATAMNHHDVGRDRGGTAAALRRITAPTLVVGVDSDRLYPVRQQRDLASHLRDAALHTITSAHGHDGFLLETDQADAALRTLIPARRAETV
ncbi:homoserine O-acetyltransferase MetX [Actinokineospora fastidiosa]|uniref:Homoserine O-acetyltransferase n=1 Tax=Actinokineospora fastidiosa TaxID=1816 RepID=A0A918GTF8_9PSEU|nr:homoserine O-acetyltransferase [Actinokineospora fastidiosa]GGS56683.1 homoserine O-acetyltransferase [Actinokineospora fastidiosa]